MSSDINRWTRRVTRFAPLSPRRRGLEQRPGLHAQSTTFTPRLKTPRIAPVPEEERTEAQRQMISSRQDLNIYKTLAHHPELFSRWSGLGRFLLNGSSIPARRSL